MTLARSQSRGFTLLELLVAMFIVSTIAATLYSGLNTSFRAKRRIEASVVPVRAAGAALEIIARDLDSAVLPHPESANLESEIFYLAGPFMAGTQTGASADALMSFFCIGSESLPNVPLTEGVRRVELALVGDGTSTVLVRRIARNLLSGDLTLPAEEEEVLCERVRTFTLRFFDGLEWVESWDSTQLFDIDGAPAIPMLVQMELLLEVPDVAQAGEEAGTYRITKIVPIAIAKAVDVDATTAALTGQTVGP